MDHQGDRSPVRLLIQGLEMLLDLAKAMVQGAQALLDGRLVALDGARHLVDRGRDDDQEAVVHHLLDLFHEPLRLLPGDVGVDPGVELLGEEKGRQRGAKQPQEGYHA